MDVIIRNLLDLDPGITEIGKADDGSEKDGQKALRHTYLRVLCPLLKNTQLAREGNNYKREEVRRLMYLLVNRSSAHFAPVDETVIRLVLRCKQVEWLKEDGDEQDVEIERKLSEIAPNDSDVTKNMLGRSLDQAGVSSLSVVDVSAKVTKEKPSVPAPRRNRRRKKEANGVEAHANGRDGDGLLRVPPEDVPRIVEPDREGGRSPFADDNAED